VKDVRGARKAERQYGDDARQCPVCKRWFTRRCNKFCSPACAQKAAEGKNLFRNADKR